MTTDPKAFWEQKILRWEADRYGAGSADAPFLEKLARRASRSLRARLAIAAELLRPHVAGKRVVELGCGSGLLTDGLIEAGAASYRGYDIAESAIAAARARAQASPHADRVAYDVADVGALPPLQADVVFSLGLFDWLTTEQIEAVFRAGGDSDYLHAIAEKRVSLSQYVHRAYVYVSYGHRTGAYVPRYFRVAELEAAAARHNRRPMNVFRTPALSFGALLTTLPVPPR
jgi:SAM-dependent methyltransferase